MDLGIQMDLFPQYHLKGLFAYLVRQLLAIPPETNFFYSAPLQQRTYDVVVFGEVEEQEQDDDHT